METGGEPITTKTWLIISIVVNVFLIVICWRDEKDNIDVKYIKSHTIDTMWYGDSTYVIKHKIEKVFYNENANDEPKYDQY